MTIILQLASVLSWIMDSSCGPNSTDEMLRRHSAIIISSWPTPGFQTRMPWVTDGMISCAQPCWRKHRSTKNNTPTAAFYIWQLFAGRSRCQLTRRGRRYLVSQKKRKIILGKTWENLGCKITKSEINKMKNKQTNKHEVNMDGQKCESIIRFKLTKYGK